MELFWYLGALLGRIWELPGRFLGHFWGIMGRIWEQLGVHGDAPGLTFGGSGADFGCPGVPERR